MKTFIYLIFTCFISTGGFLGALNGRHPFVLYGVGFGVWAWFLWGLSRRMKKQAERRQREQSFEDFMRHQMRNFRR